MGTRQKHHTTGERKCQEPPRTDKNQKLTNADLRTTHYSTPSTKLDPPRRTLPTIRGRRCSRRMAHSDLQSCHRNLMQSITTAGPEGPAVVYDYIRRQLHQIKVTGLCDSSLRQCEIYIFCYFLMLLKWRVIRAKGHGGCTAVELQGCIATML